MERGARTSAGPRPAPGGSLRGVGGDAGDRSDALARYAAALRAAPHNLASARALAALEERHLPECEALADALPPGPATLVDVGSGGGLPGLVIALARPDLEVWLLEARRKKVDFLTATARELGVSVETVHGRAEALGRGRLRGAFDVATARAVAPLPRLVAWTLPLLRPGGQLYAVKGAGWREELAAARSVLARETAEVVATPEDPPADRGLAADMPRVVIIRRAA